MYKFKNSLIALIGMVSLMTVVTVVLPHISYGSGGNSAPTPSTQNVKVVNTPSEPVPIQGTATVSGTVQAAQAGTWNVGITGTPVVGLDAANNTVKFDSVNNTVKIDAATPVLVRDVDNPPRRYQDFRILDMADGQASNGIFFSPVPNGKRLVIEFISVVGHTQPGQTLQLAEIYVQTFYSGNSLPYDVQVNGRGQDPFSHLDLFAGSKQVRLSADGGTQPQLFAQRSDSTGQARVEMTVSGYLVNEP